MQPPVIDPEFAAIIPPLADEELAGLEASIIAEGCRDALVTWQGTLLDGHNRLAICQRHDLPYRTTAIDLPDRLTAMIWIQQAQQNRRNLTDDQRAMNAATLLELLSEQAKRERAKAGRAVGGKATPEQKEERTDRLWAHGAPKRSEPKERSRTKAARSANVAEKRVRRCRTLRIQNPLAAEAVLMGELTLADALRTERTKATINTGKVLKDAVVVKTTAQRPHERNTTIPIKREYGAITVVMSHTPKRAAGVLLEKFNAEYLRELVAELTRLLA